MHMYIPVTTMVRSGSNNGTGTPKAVCMMESRIAVPLKEACSSTAIGSPRKNPAKAKPRKFFLDLKKPITPPVAPVKQPWASEHRIERYKML